MLRHARAGSGLCFRLGVACAMLVACKSHGSSPDAAIRRDGSADADAGSCQQREQRASQAISDVLATADLHCKTRSDCAQISIDTLCHAACGALVSKDGKAVIEAAIADQNRGPCADFEESGCVVILPPCAPPTGFDCVAGRCTDAAQ